MQKITMSAVASNIPVVTEKVEVFLEEIDCPMKIVMQIDIAIDEILCNIASYAYKEETGDFSITVDYCKETSEVTMVFEDSGIPYNPLAKDDPDVTLSADEREIGGLGIFMVKKSMDDMRYEYKNEKNILTIVKKI